MTLFKSTNLKEGGPGHSSLPCGVLLLNVFPHSSKKAHPKLQTCVLENGKVYVGLPLLFNYSPLHSSNNSTLVSTGSLSNLDAERGAWIEGKTTAQVIEGYLQKNEVSEHSSILNTTDIAIQK